MLINPSSSYPYAWQGAPTLKDAFRIIDSLSKQEITPDLCESELRKMGFFLHDPVTFNQLLPKLKRLPLWQFRGMMVALDEKGLTPLHYEGNLRATLDAFKGKSFQALFPLFSLRDNLGKTLLHFPHLFEISFPLFVTYTVSEVRELLSIWDDNGVTPLEVDEVFQSVGKKLLMTKCFDFVEQRYRFNQLFEILKIKNKSGKRLLHSPAILRHALNHLGDLEAAKILQILQLQNAQGRTVLHNYETFEVVRHLLEKLSSDEIWKLFIAADINGLRPLEVTHSLPKVKRVLREKLGVIKSVKLLIITNHGDPSLQMSALSFFEERIKSVLLEKFLSDTLNSQTTTHFNQKLLDTFSFLLEECTSKELFEFFSIQDEIRENILFKPTFYSPLLHHLNRVEPPSLTLLFSKRNPLGFTVLHHLDKFGYAWQIIKNLPFDIQLSLFSIKDRNGLTPLHDPYVLLEFLKIQNLGPEKLQKIMLIQNRYGMSVLLNGILLCSFNKEFLETVYQINFDPITIQPGLLPGVLYKAIAEWLDSNPKVEKGKSPLFWPLLLGLDDFVVERLVKLPPSEQKLLYRQFPQRAAELQTLLTLRSFRVCPRHMSAGVDLTEKPPPSMDLRLLKFTGLENKVYEDFHSFIPDMIAASKKELSEVTINQLQEMYEKILQNKEHLYFAENERVRREQYKEFCNYLAHVVYAYKIGQAGGDEDFKKIVLELVGEAQRECRPRWMNEIKKLYSSRPGQKEVTLPPHTLIDKVLQRLRIERIRILELKIHNVHDGEFERENFHEANYRLNLFRNELDTRLDPIDDPSAAYDSYPLSKHLLRSSFYFFYTKGFIVQSIQNHLNDSPDNVSQAKSERIDSLYDTFNLPKDEVETWFKDQCPPEWGKKTYHKVVENALAMDSPSEAEALLSKYGIFVQLETTVAEALNGLEREIQRAKLKIRSFKALFNEIKELKDSTELFDFLTRNTEFPSDTPLEKLEEEASNIKKKHENKLKSLENLQNEVNSLPSEKEKKEKLAQANRIQPADDLEELLTEEVIEEARLNEFVKRIFRNEKELYTHQAVIFMLTKMDILEKATAQEIFS